MCVGVGWWMEGCGWVPVHIVVVVDCCQTKGICVRGCRCEGCWVDGCGYILSLQWWFTAVVIASLTCCLR